MEEINGGNTCPTYLYRWTILRVGSIAVYLHKFVGEDWSIDKHDHPKRFWSIGLRGWYYEDTPMGVAKWSAPWFRTFPATHVHRLFGPTSERPCWTLVITGPAVREWGFWQFGRFIPWREYVRGDKKRKACP